MRLYTLMINNELIAECYTSLKPLCKAYKIGYSSVAHGKRLFWKEGVKTELIELTLNKIKGRGKHSKGFKPKAKAS